jgi:3-isopropylmalate dehydrogenase
MPWQYAMLGIPVGSSSAFGGSAIKQPIETCTASQEPAGAAFYQGGCAAKRWARLIGIADKPRVRALPAFTIGVFPGEGISPEVIDAALTVLEAVESVNSGVKFDVRRGGAIGNEAIRECGEPLSPQVCNFCREVFAEGGAILAGAGGDRFVYETRRRFDLFCKLNPLVPATVPLLAGRFRPEHVAGVDILVVRENLGGVYQGEWSERKNRQNERVAEHRFSYSEPQIRRILQVAAALSLERRGELTVVVKPNGVPAISQLWIECARETARQSSIAVRELEIDYAVFQMLQNPKQFDVVVTSNMYGDVISDVGGVLLGSRGLCYGGNFSSSGAAVYQTNHGAAHDLAGTDRANPIGQIYSLAMLLRESFGLARGADLIHSAVERVWRSGARTFDLAEAGCQIVGTKEMGRRVAAAVVELANGGP